LEWIHHDHKAVYANRHVGADARGYGDRLHVEDHRTHDVTEDPRAEHCHRESEGHAEDREDKVGHGEVNEVRAKVRARSLPARKYYDHGDVADDRQDGR